MHRVKLVTSLCAAHLCGHFFNRLFLCNPSQHTLNQGHARAHNGAKRSTSAAAAPKMFPPFRNRFFPIPKPPFSPSFLAWLACPCGCPGPSAEPNADELLAGRLLPSLAA